MCEKPATDLEVGDTALLKDGRHGIVTSRTWDAAGVRITMTGHPELMCIDREELVTICG